VARGETVQLAPLLAATSATAWRLEAQRPFALPAFALESPLAGLASLDRLTSLSLRYLTEGAAADPDAWEAIIDSLTGLKELHVGVCTAWSPELFAALARLHSLEVLGLTGLPTPDLEGSDQPVPALTALGRTLAHLPSLRELHLTDFLLTPGTALSNENGDMSYALTESWSRWRGCDTQIWPTACGAPITLPVSSSLHFAAWPTSCTMYTTKVLPTCRPSRPSWPPFPAPPVSHLYHSSAESE